MSAVNGNVNGTRVNGNHINGGPTNSSHFNRLSSEDHSLRNTTVKHTSLKPKPVAIIGLSCRLPGDATDPEKLWNLVSEGRSAWSTVPKNRFNQDAFYHPTPETTGTVS